MLYNCKEYFDFVKEKIKNKLNGKNVKVLIVRANDDEPSERYVRNKLKDFEDIGVNYTYAYIPKETRTKEVVLDAIHKLVRNSDGIILQRPLCANDCESEDILKQALGLIPMHKDIDGAKSKSSMFYSACLLAFISILDLFEVDLYRKSILIIGQGEVGAEIATYALKHKCTIFSANSSTNIDELQAAFEHADIVVSAAGVKLPLYLKENHPDKVIIDYGIHYGENGKLEGDIPVENADKCQYQTSVPGGMGLMVRAALLMNISLLK